MLKQVVLWFALIMSLGGCGRKFLDVKPVASQKVPETIEDYMGILDYISTMNANSSHALGMIGGDELVMTAEQYATFPTDTKLTWQLNAYLWREHIYEGGEGDPVYNPLDWNMAYERILKVNVVLDGISKMSPSAELKASWNNVKGVALFHRAFNYYCLAQLFCPVYQQPSEHSDLGLPLRLEGDVTAKVGRSNLGDTYHRILTDLKDAESLLPNTWEVKFRPGKAAVYALLARIYLQLEDYGLAYSYAQQCLELENRLEDYNALDLSLNPTFGAYGEGNQEIIWMNSGLMVGLLFADAFVSIDSSLLVSYGDGDLRKEAFFGEGVYGSGVFKGSYEGTTRFFTGLATDEVYLIRAECAAREGNLDQAFADLRLLLKNRIHPEKFASYDFPSESDILSAILDERRKELILRGVRWEDLRRLNREAQYAKVLERKLGDIRAELKPGDTRYVWPIPFEAVQIGGYLQNDR